VRGRPSRATPRGAGRRPPWCSSPCPRLPGARASPCRRSRSDRAIRGGFRRRRSTTPTSSVARWCRRLLAVRLTPGSGIPWTCAVEDLLSDEVAFRARAARSRCSGADRSSTRTTARRGRRRRSPRSRSRRTSDDAFHVSADAGDVGGGGDAIACSRPWFISRRQPNVVFAPYRADRGVLPDLEPVAGSGTVAIRSPDLPRGRHGLLGRLRDPVTSPELLRATPPPMDARGAHEVHAAAGRSPAAACATWPGDRRPRAHHVTTSECGRGLAPGRTTEYDLRHPARPRPAWTGSTSSCSWRHAGFLRAHRGARWSSSCARPACRRGSSRLRPRRAQPVFSGTGTSADSDAHAWVEVLYPLVGWVP